VQPTVHPKQQKGLSFPMPNRNPNITLHRYLCPLCGKEFRSKETSAKFCSRACRDEARRKKVTFTCKQCSGELTISPWEAKDKQFCSLACRDAWKIAHKELTETPCPQCGKMICKVVTNILSMRRRFCSIKCRSTWFSLKNRNTESDEWRKKIAAGHTGKRTGANNWRFGKPPGHGRGAWVDTPKQGKAWMRSSWEITIAGYLTAQKVEWLYEPETFTLENDKTYTPDFYIPEWGCYWEVKGWVSNRALETIAMFRRVHPDKPIVMITKPIYTAIERLGPFSTTELAGRVKTIPTGIHRIILPKQRRQISATLLKYNADHQDAKSKAKRKLIASKAQSHGVA
jgi:endogenous inhibitor of DNA gyrase (YacG/DUF329 family)